jgi:hypothetical protein
MKIKITESQAIRLKLISENSDPISQFEGFCKAKLQELNRLYTKITSMSIIEILNKEIDMAAIYKTIDAVDDQVYKGDKQAYDYLESLPEETDIKNLDLRIDKAHSSIKDKINALQLIVMELEKLQDMSETHNLPSMFGDVKPIDISGMQ